MKAARWEAARASCASIPASTPPRRSCTTTGKRSISSPAISSSETTSRAKGARRSMPRPMPAGRRASITARSNRTAAACSTKSTTTTRARSIPAEAIFLHLLQRVGGREVPRPEAGKHPGSHRKLAQRLQLKLGCARGHQVRLGSGRGGLQDPGKDLMPLECAFRLACAAIVASVAASCSAERAQRESERKEIGQQLTAAYYS